MAAWACQDQSHQRHQCTNVVYIGDEPQGVSGSSSSGIADDLMAEYLKITAECLFWKHEHIIPKRTIVN
jgi:hypothetical protein